MRFIFGWSRVCLAVFLLSFITYSEFVPGMVKASAKTKPVSPKSQPLHMTVILERVFLDGEISEEVVHETCWSMENFWAKYDQWRVIDIDGNTMVFRKQIDDISPLLKDNGYFGITDDGILTIFNGRPDKLRIIQSFFQIDIKKLESKKQEELIQGIPIKTKDRYVKVLETFKQYSIKE